jgi:hypothetical protein
MEVDQTGLETIPFIPIKVDDSPSPSADLEEPVTPPADGSRDAAPASPDSTASSPRQRPRPRRPPSYDKRVQTELRMAAKRAAAGGFETLVWRLEGAQYDGGSVMVPTQA